MNNILLEWHINILRKIMNNWDINENTLGGIPTVKGTRFTVSQLVVEVIDLITEDGTLLKLCNDYDIDYEDSILALHGVSNYFEDAPRPQKPQVHTNPNEDNIVLSKREFINAWNKWGSLNLHTLWNLLKTEAK